MKRLFDFTAAITILLCLSPFMIVLAVVIRVEMGSPVVFSQTRPGLSSKPFAMYKFRSMTDGRDENGNLLPDEQRITRLGAFIRATSLDELPELFNIIKGEMSLVGPRPLLQEYLPLYSDKQIRRHDVRPGLTGWAQINGRNAISWEQKFELDVWYVDHQSFWLDVKILFMTLAKVFRQDDISAPNHATMEKFKGTQ